jgi:hypothetical protein
MEHQKIMDTLETYHPLRLIFGLREASIKIGGSAFVSSNSENISCVTFLKHKNNRIQGTGTVASC